MCCCCCCQDAVRELLPGQLEAQPELLDQLGTMISPKLLKREGVQVYSTLQVRTNDMILTVEVAMYHL
jgi:hypothetical protein